ncbi:SIR2 family protein [Cupriavidus consociatus]|uniref:SIR2 family protein n=1 Tax=Cupriavidus consociatus TaxID=2821357 RepID=UPI001AEAD322|nr:MULTISPECIES: SIR2 family protein [unclassified Cupriavidus]MBP0622873.1 SIR2 family protein [Cupriavidus sp. LEh25]MDK2659560.1 SIR2 family protein [Cupriavidus sp. LEh21]
MTPKHEVEAFIKSFVSDLEEDSVAIFAGAGMSKASGYVDWPELLRDIAAELGLRVELEHDLISLAQFHVNQRKTSDGLAKKILQEFSEQAELSDVHKVIARLPIKTYWTTNYDTLIEDALRQADRVADIKSDVDDLSTIRPKRDAVVYKMHGDVRSSGKAVLYKKQYETYYKTHERFVTALSGDLVSKTFLFIGFSFTDPNLDYVLSRLHGGGAGKKTHYCFMKAIARDDKDDDEAFRYKQRKQELRIDDLKRFGIQTLLVGEYDQIPQILLEVEKRFLKKTIFVSGSAEEYGTWDRNAALGFVHSLAEDCIKANLRIVNGFGWGIGSSVINGALKAIYANPLKYSEDQLILRPFPQHGDNMQALWEEYRQRMISLAGIAIFMFGNKLQDGKIVPAGGVRREFEIAIEHGLVPIPVGATGYMARELWVEVMKDPKKYYSGIEWIIPLVEELGKESADPSELLKTVVKIFKQLNK